MAEDTDSDWDSSTLDFSTTPRPPIGSHQQPRIEMDAIQETSEHSSLGRPSPKPKPREKTSGSVLPKGSDSNLTSLINGGNSNGGNVPLKSDDSQAKSKAEIAADDNKSREQLQSQDNHTEVTPPYNFKGLYRTDGEKVTETENSRPGRDKRENPYLYDPEPVRNEPTKRSDNEGLGSWDDSEAEERVMQQVRETFNKSKSRESPPKREEGRVNSETRLYNDDRNNRQTKPQAEKRFAKRVKKQPVQKGSATEMSVDVNDQPAIMMSQSTVTMSDLNLEVGSPISVGKYVTQVTVEEGMHGKRYVYYFDKGNMQFYEVEDVDANAVIPPVADKVEKLARRGFQECFGVLRIVFVCVVLFVVELLRFVFGVVIGPLVSGVLAVLGNYFFKPVFAGTFNAVLQPLFILLWNTFSGLRHVLGPLFDISKNVVSQLAMVLQAFRLVEINHVTRGPDDRQRHAVQLV